MTPNDDNATPTPGAIAPDAPLRPGEAAHSGEFADALEAALAGQTPVALRTDVRAALHSAVGVHASMHSHQLADADIADLVTQAIAGMPRANTVATPDVKPTAQAPQQAAYRATLSLADASHPTVRHRQRRVLHWSGIAAATCAAAAGWLLWLLAVPGPNHNATTTRVAPARPRSPEPAPRAWPQTAATDALIGTIAPHAAGDAQLRIDMIYATRLADYREVYTRHGGTW